MPQLAHGHPMGATDLATPGVSPTTFGASPLIGATCAGASLGQASSIMPSPMMGVSPGMGNSSSAATSTTGADTATVSSMTGESLPFDGGGVAGIAPGTCAASTTASPPFASSMGPGSSVGPAGFPLCSTELGGGVLSPSVALNPNPSAPTITLTPLPATTPPNSLVTPQSTALRAAAEQCRRWHLRERLRFERGIASV